MKPFLPSSSSLASSSSAFLSLSCIITRLAMEAKVRFVGAVEEVEGAVLEAVVGEAGAESIALEMVWVDGGEEWDNLVASVVFFVEDEDLASWEEAAEWLLEMGEGGVCIG